MLRSLRAQLLASYAFIILLTLVMVGVALALILLSVDAEARRTYQSLIRIGVLRRDEVTGLETTEALDAQLGAIAQTEAIRVLRVGAGAEVLYDSSGEFTPGRTLPLDNLTQRAGQAGRLRGTYVDPTTGAQYVFVAIPSLMAGAGQIVLSQEVTRPPVLSLAQDTLIRPLLQAGVVSLIIGAGLALVVSGSIAKPLSQVAESARRIAGGDYSVEAPIKGPTEVRDVAASFNDMVTTVTRNQQAQQEFLASVSHDLKTPLTSIQGFSQAILDGAASDPAHAARVIHDEAARMRRMVDELLDLARIQSGQAVLTRTYIHMPKLIDAIMERLTPQAEAQQVTLQQTGERRLRRITGDGDRLAQVFTNLVDNAITHTPPGGTVTVSTGADEGGIVITVSDTGRGIPQDDLAHIFERFYQVDKARSGKRRGSGLGLTIVKEIVHAHDGRIHVESVVGQGTTFTVWLPLPRQSDITVRQGGSPS